jgi:hypothetical protein
MVKFINCKKVKCAIKFVRALLTNFLIRKNLIWKRDKSMMNILGIAKMLIGRYGGHNDKLWFLGVGCTMMTHKYRGSQQSSREVKPKFIDSTQGEPKNIYKP